MKDARREKSKEMTKQIELFLMDVDGVLTDGRIVYGPGKSEWKFFDVKDGHGIKLMQRAGIRVGIITGRKSDVVARRSSELGIEFVFQGQFDKIAALSKIMKKTGFGWEKIAYVGDDIVDIPVLRRVGFAATVQDAVQEVKEVAHYVSQKPGGRGAIREIIEYILKNKGLWDTLVSKYFE
ncbi:MAG: HAD-IIIA family hydrolase [Deltaproteobacteria bacterium]|jgi:3-deoxy-D-manno-octulosonate 8-phosphate phosphatase (KDO 8-P phosphatase)|nr:HAD-IIIA family hydrolase [Deltaproteobacteria bacterium]